ncbi:MAG TPA: hypothetical protein VH858_11870 [Hyphomicrobiales bacterium]
MRWRKQRAGRLKTLSDACVNLLGHILHEGLSPEIDLAQIIWAIPD